LVQRLQVPGSEYPEIRNPDESAIQVWGIGKCHEFHGQVDFGQLSEFDSISEIGNGEIQVVYSGA